MKKDWMVLSCCLLICGFTVLTSCSVNPFRSDNELTGTATGTAVGAGVGAGATAIAGASKAEIALGAIAGGALGYYVSSLSFSSGGITHVGGKVYTLGDFAMIEIQSDNLFEVNTSDLLPEANPILDSVVAVLNRYPNNNIMISGNTNGYYTNRYERALSTNRARQVAAYLWAHGINNFADLNTNIASAKDQHSYLRKFTYVGYGSYFPISSTLTVEGRRQNDRVQVISYPSKSRLHLNKCGRVFSNIGNSTDNASLPANDNQIQPDINPAPSTRLGSNENDASDSDLRAEKWETY